MTFELVARDEVLKRLNAEDNGNEKKQKATLCDLLDCSKKELENLIMELKKEKEKKNRHRWTPSEERELIYMIEVGKSIDEIALKFDIEEKSKIYDKIKVLRKNGKIQKRGTKKMNNADIKKMNEEPAEVMLNVSLTEEQIKELKCERDTLKKLRESYIKDLSRQADQLEAMREVLAGAMEYIEKLHSLLKFVDLR